MLRTVMLVGVAAGFLVLPSGVTAGGPPRLIVPIDGVTAENSGKCSELLASKLKDKIWSSAGHEQGVQIRVSGNQPILAFNMNDEVRLRDLEAALNGTNFSIPRERLRFFGHVVLEITGIKSPKLVADLDAIPFVSVAEQQPQKDSLRVTVDMPYPRVDDRRPDFVSAEDTFTRNFFSTASDSKTETSATADDLPSFVAIRDVVAKNNGKLTDIGWSTTHACRTLGCVALAASKQRVAAAR